MVNIKVTVDTKKAKRYLRKTGENINTSMNKALDLELTFLMLAAKMLAPRRTGNLKRGIYTGRIKNTRGKKEGYVLWRELDPERGVRFSKSASKQGNFAEWMHKSPSALKQRWKSGVPRFFDAAVETRRNATIKSVKAEVSKAVKR